MAREARQDTPESGGLSDPSLRRVLETEIAALCAGEDRVFAGLEAYRKGSAFLRPPAGDEKDEPPLQ